ncbi:MAG: Lsr2 family DNA-binding protein [Mycobacteriales bacterium]
MRRWARENGHVVAGRGRVPNSILAAYRASAGS